MFDKKISEESLIKIEKNFSKLKTRIKPSKSNPVLKNNGVLSCLGALQKKLFLFLLIKHPTMLLFHENGIMLKWY